MVHQLFSNIASRYDLANRILSGGLDLLWRRAVVRAVACRRPVAVLDLAAGSGDLSLALQTALPASEVVAADFCAPMLEQARIKGVRNRVVADALDLPFPAARFDVVTVSFGLRNMESWETALREMHRVLRPGGMVFILDFSLPIPAVRPFYRWYLHAVLPRLAGWVTGEPEAYEYLGDSIESFPSGTAMLARLENAGFSDAKSRPLSLGIATLYQASRGVVA
jgi:demethylmenaquinone methyltransferase/2-methoxy-6-polyprenyl-1,4-benzoquinol methylase